MMVEQGGGENCTQLYEGTFVLVRASSSILMRLYSQFFLMAKRKAKNDQKEKIQQVQAISLEYTSSSHRFLIPMDLGVQNLVEDGYF